MPTNISNITLAQIQSATKAQIITVLTNWLNNHTKAQIIEWLWDDIQTIRGNPIMVSNANGETSSQTETTTNIETGALVSTRTTTWVYYPSGPINTITIVDKDAGGNVTGTTTIQHYLDGRQPTAVTV